MDKREFALIAAALQTYFPRYNMLPTPEAKILWYQSLQDLSADVLSAALQKWVNTERFPPTIAELRSLCAEIQHGPAPDWGEAWGEVVKAIGRYGWSREKEALDSMSPPAAQAARRIGWNAICTSENPDTIRAQFRQVYETVEHREMEDRQLPAALKETIAGITQRLGEGSCRSQLPESREMN